MSKEKKFHRTHLFLECEPTSDPTAHHPATTARTLGSAGWDSSRISHFCFFGRLPDGSDLYCTGKRSPVGERMLVPVPIHILLLPPWNCMFIYLESYVHLLERIYKDPTGTDPEDFALFDKLLPLEAYHYIQSKQLSQVLSVFVLPHECQHIIVERYLANLYSVVCIASPAQPLLPCGDACGFCLYKGLYPEFPAIVVEGVKRVFEDLFIGDHQISGNPTIDGGFAVCIPSFYA